MSARGTARPTGGEPAAGWPQANLLWYSDLCSLPCMACLLRLRDAMMLEPYEPQRVARNSPTPSKRRWRPVDIALIIGVACYGAAMLVVAVGVLVRLAH